MSSKGRAHYPFTEQGRAGEGVGTAGRVAGDREPVETEGVRELGHVERPVLEAPTRLQIREADAGPVYSDEAYTCCLSCLLVRAPEPGERRAVEEEDRFPPQIPPLRISEGATIPKPHTLVSDRPDGDLLYSPDSLEVTSRMRRAPRVYRARNSRSSRHGGRPAGGSIPLSQLHQVSHRPESGRGKHSAGRRRQDWVVALRTRLQGATSKRAQTAST
jgi:hypothetical protein